MEVLHEPYQTPNMSRRTFKSVVSPGEDSLTTTRDTDCRTQLVAWTRCGGPRNQKDRSSSHSVITSFVGLRPDPCLLARILLWVQSGEPVIAFETLLLGLVIGHAPIRLMVSPPVATVELRLDGMAIGLLHGPPWELECDFGTSLMPHQLTAVGFDAAGKEVGRAQRAVNLGRKRTDVSLLPESDGKLRPAAVRVAWNATAVDTTSPVVTASLDGSPMRVKDAHRIALPALDLRKPHLVSVEVSFSETLRDRADVVLGGDVAETAASELTATAVMCPQEREPLDLGQMRGVFKTNATELEPVAVDYGRAEVAVVLSAEAVDLLASKWILQQSDPRTVDPVLRRLARMQKQPKPDTDVFFVVKAVPIPIHEAGTAFAMGRQTRLSWLRESAILQSLAGPPGSEPQRLADAVSVAGGEVAGSNHRRAVVVVVAETTQQKAAGGWKPDASTLGVAAAKAFLGALHVPLVIWSLTGEPSPAFTAAWGASEDVSEGQKMREAANQLGARLALQRIIWFAGRHLPQRITLDESRTALRLAQ